MGASIDRWTPRNMERAHDERHHAAERSSPLSPGPSEQTERGAPPVEQMGRVCRRSARSRYVARARREARASSSLQDVDEVSAHAANHSAAVDARGDAHGERDRARSSLGGRRVWESSPDPSAGDGRRAVPRVRRAVQCGRPARPGARGMDRRRRDRAR